MIGRRHSSTAGALALLPLRVALQLWPLGLTWPALIAGNIVWRDGVLGAFTDHTTLVYRLAYHAWPTMTLVGPVTLLLLAALLHRAHRAPRRTVIAGLGGIAVATFVLLRPEWVRLSPYLGQVPAHVLLSAVDPAYLHAFAFGTLGFALGGRTLRDGPTRRSGLPLQRARSDNHGHADWLSLKEARRLFPGPDPVHGGLVVGEAYRVDLDPAAKGPFDPAAPRSWGQGGKAPLLIDPCRTGPTHGLVFAGSGGFKTTATAVPTLLAWTTSAVVLDPAREIGPLVTPYRAGTLGQRVVTLDPGDPATTAAFNALDWIDPASPLAEANVEAVATWLAGEPVHGTLKSGAEFFRDMGKSLIACLLADLLADPALEPEDKTLRRLRQALVTPEAQMRERLEDVHASSASALARDLAGTLMGLVPETFSGVYANASQATRWLSVRAYADLVSGQGFTTAELCGGRLTVLVQLPLKTLQTTPGLGRVVIGSLLNAAYEADGQVQGRILFLFDEVARLGPMAVLEIARDAGRKHGLTLLLLYQSQGQLLEQWGKDGARAWYDGTSWRLYAALQDPATARELASACGEHGVVATSHGNTSGRQGHLGQALPATSSSKAATKAEIGRALIKPDELLQDTRGDEAFVLARGTRPLRCGRAIYFRRPEMLAAVGTSSRFPTRTVEPPRAEPARVANTFLGPPPPSR